MSDTFDPGAHKPSATDPNELPTAYGGTIHVEPTKPGQSLGQIPDPDDAGVDDAGDHLEASGSQSPNMLREDVLVDEQDDEPSERRPDRPEDPADR